MTQVMGDRFAKVFAWYDNEWGFSNRMVELAQLVASQALADSREALADEQPAPGHPVDPGSPDREQARLRARRLQRPARGRARSPTTRASARRCRRSSTRSSAARASSAPATSAGRRRGRTRGSASSRAPRAWPSCSGRTCTLPEDCVGDAAKKVVYDLRGGQVCLLENLRFHPEEEKDDEGFCRELAELADVYVDDAFGAVHRAHASVHGLAKLYRDRGCGFLLEKEIAALGQDRRPRPRSPTWRCSAARRSATRSRSSSRSSSASTSSSSAARWPTRSSRPRARTCRRRWSRTTSSPWRARSSTRRATAASSVLLPVDVVVAASIEAVGGRRPSRVDAVPAGDDGARHRPRERRALRRALRRRQDDLLERADGPLREGALRRRHVRGGPRHRRLAGLHGRRRRRQRGGGLRRRATASRRR